MQTIIQKDFMLHTETAGRLYKSYAEPMPIIDYHCHLSPQEIYEDKHFNSITEVWLGGDHYKWRLLRAIGFPEELITGNAPDREKFKAYAYTIARAAGNPLYHWTHLELARYFGYEGCLTEDTADEVFDLCALRLKEESMGARGLITSSRVKVLCTTDDPADDLRWHEKLAAEWDGSRVLPAWRPDKAVYIEQEGFTDYLKKLAEAAGHRIDSLPLLKAVLRQRLDHFAAHGCVLSDHGLPGIPFREAGEEEADIIFQKRLSGLPLTEEETEAYQTHMLLALGREYAARGWVMQLHFGVQRNLKSRGYKSIGPDAGFDAIGRSLDAEKLARFLNALDKDGALPKMILYSLNPQDNVAIESVAGCFQEGPGAGKLQHGSAWWFNDHDAGMRAQMRDLMSQGMIASFVGMLTDSRSFLSYTRHEYFRRILCDLLGELVEKGEFPADEIRLREIIEGVCYKNAEKYFGF